MPLPIPCCESEPEQHLAEAMATKKLSIKLLLDKQSNKVLFAEASSDFVDFLFGLLSMPIASVIKLLKKDRMSGCLANLYESVENFSEDYILPNQNKDSLLKSKSTFTATNLLMPSQGAVSVKTNYFSCSQNNHRHVTDQHGSACPSCYARMTTPITYVGLMSTTAAPTTGSTGFVKGLISYMVTDDLVVTPMSTVSSIALLNKFDVDSVRSLEEKVVNVGMQEGLELLKASMQSDNVLSEVFLRKKARKK